MRFFQSVIRIRFDKQLTFKNQISYLQETCINRLNFLKIVTKRTYGLNLKTLEQLYISLVRSIMEYSAILSPTISTSNFNKLNIIQRKSIKIMQRKSIYSSMPEINTDIIDLTERFDELNTKYFTNAYINNNELVKEACNDYIEAFQNRESESHRSILFKYKDLLSSFR